MSLGDNSGDSLKDFLDFLTGVLPAVQNPDGTFPYVFTAECSELHTNDPERLKAMIGA